MSSQKNKDKEQTERCQACTYEIAPEKVEENRGRELSCTMGHYFCPECVPVLLMSKFDGANMQMEWPFKCPLSTWKGCECAGTIPEAQVERSLSEEQRQIYLTIRIINTLQSNEKLISCTKCPNSDIRVVANADEVIPLWWCVNGCGNGHCTICKQDLPEVKDDEKYNAAQDEILNQHLLVCAYFHKPKNIIDLAIFEGAQGQCPNCKMGGVKGVDECTHMTCNACTGQWCYVCELDVQDCDRNNQEESIYAHNVNWDTTEKRCPMYLTDIWRVDNDWPRDSARCIEFFHRRKTLNNLSEAIYGLNGMGLDLYIKLCETYNSLRNNGFQLDDIPKTPQLLYKINRAPVEQPVVEQPVQPVEQPIQPVVHSNNERQIARRGSCNIS